MNNDCIREVTETTDIYPAYCSCCGHQLELLMICINDKDEPLFAKLGCPINFKGRIDKCSNSKIWAIEANSFCEVLEARLF